VLKGLFFHVYGELRGEIKWFGKRGEEGAGLKRMMIDDDKGE
jgi:hypothetical protein